jgi:hypothetical protein
LLVAFIVPSLRSAWKSVDMEVGKAIAPPRRIGRLGSLRGGPRSACCAAGKHCNGSLQVNSRRTGLLSKSPAGSRLSILRTRRCGCHARRYIEAFSFRLVAPLKKSSLAIFAASAASAVLAMPSIAVWAKGSRMQYRLANGRQSSTGTLGRRSGRGSSRNLRSDAGRTTLAFPHPGQVA